METNAKKNISERVKRALTVELASHGFARTKPTFWTRGRDAVVEFIHLHLFTFAPVFRVHLGVRVLNDTFPAVALNGMSSHDGWYQGARKYYFHFDESEQSAGLCTSELYGFCVDIAIPWFEQFRDDGSLLGSTSPLTAEAKVRLQMAIDDKAETGFVQVSEKLLGIK